jgi:hypothetical protein
VIIAENLEGSVSPEERQQFFGLLRAAASGFGVAVVAAVPPDFIGEKGERLIDISAVSLCTTAPPFANSARESACTDCRADHPREQIESRARLHRLIKTASPRHLRLLRFCRIVDDIADEQTRRSRHVALRWTNGSRPSPHHSTTTAAGSSRA